MQEFVGMQERLFRLRWMIQKWELGPEIPVNNKWIRRAMLIFTGEELNQGISRDVSWGGLTDVLQAAITLCKADGQERSKEIISELWMEHNFDELVTNLIGKFGEEYFTKFNDDMSYDDASNSVKLELLKLVNCETKQKLSWYERGQRLIYVHFVWPEGENLGRYHVLLNGRGEVLHKWQYRFKMGRWDDFKLSKGRLVYGGDEENIYSQERRLLQAASKEFVGLKSEILGVLQRSKLSKFAELIMEFWGYDMPRMVFRSLRGNRSA